MFCLFRQRYFEAPITSFCVKGLKTEPIHGAGDDVLGRIKGFFDKPGSATKDNLHLLWGEVHELGKGFEDTCALYCAGAFFQDERMVKRASRKLYALLDKERNLSPERVELLLDCINIGERMAVNGVRLREHVSKLLPMQKDERILDYARRLYVK